MYRAHVSTHYVALDFLKVRIELLNSTAQQRTGWEQRKLPRDILRH